MKRFRQDEPQRHRRPPGPRNRALADIPTTRLPWDEAVPGYFEVDLVWHSSPTAQGEFGHTLQMMDVTSGWSERVALLGRSYRVMEAGFKRLLERVPFTVLGIHPEMVQSSLIAICVPSGTSIRRLNSPAVTPTTRMTTLR